MTAKNRFRISVTFGTQPDHTYAVAEAKKDAERLRAVALAHGYRDARVVPIEDTRAKFTPKGNHVAIPYPSDLRPEAAPHGRGPRHASRDDRRGGKTRR
jgi:hypothetical protein